MSPAANRWASEILTDVWAVRVGEEAPEAKPDRVEPERTESEPV